jgi:histidinol-phosphate aminotransferase
MPISRRHLLRRLGAGAAASAAISSMPGLSLSEVLPPSPAGQRAVPIRLDRNVNPYGPSEKAIAVMREVISLVNRYPDLESDGLASTIAQAHGVGPHQVILGCGSSEILRLTTTAFLGPRKRLVMASPSWKHMAAFARSREAEVVAVPLNKAFAHDLTAMLDRIDSSTGVVYLCNPNNPTGTLTPRDDIIAFIHRVPSTVHIVIDEAYFDYVGKSSRDASLIDQAVDDDRVIVTRSFSGLYALAGLRVGYGIAAPRTASLLAAGRLPFGVNVIAARAAAAALSDTAYVRGCMQRNANDRQDFLNRVNGRMLHAIDSHTNFVMVNTGQPAEKAVEHFRKRNIILPHPFPPLDNYVRVSLGAREDMQEFWSVWDELPPPPKMSM